MRKRVFIQLILRKRRNERFRIRITKKSRVSRGAKFDSGKKDSKIARLDTEIFNDIGRKETVRFRPITVFKRSTKRGAASALERLD